MALNRTSLGLVIALVVASSGCEEDATPSASSPDSGVLDAGPARDGSLTDAAPADGSPAPAPATCNSFSPPVAPLCGGSHCKETLTELQAGRSTTGACQTEAEATAFCSLKSVMEVRACSVNYFGNPAMQRSCAQGKLPEFSGACLQCYLDSAVCAGDKCFNQCVGASNERNTGPCDTCRVAMGCISSFYSCAGYRSPITAQ